MPLMWYAGTVSDIRELAEWLAGTDDSDVQWRNNTSTAEHALTDATSMGSPKPAPDKESHGRLVPGDPKMQAATPHLRDVVAAMRARNRGRALIAARAAPSVVGAE